MSGSCLFSPLVSPPSSWHPFVLLNNSVVLRQFPGGGGVGSGPSAQPYGEYIASLSHRVALPDKIFASQKKMARNASWEIIFLLEKAENGRAGEKSGSLSPAPGERDGGADGAGDGALVAWRSASSCCRHSRASSCSSTTLRRSIACCVWSSSPLPPSLPHPREEDTRLSGPQKR